MIGSTQVKQNLGKVMRMLFLAVAMISVILIGHKPLPVEAAVPTTIKFQGKIVNQNGTDLVAGTPSCVVAGPANDTCDIMIAVAFDPVGGGYLSSSSFNNIELESNNGIFTVELPISTAAWGNDPTLYWELEFDPSGNGDFAENEIFPRRLISNAPYAYEAQELGNITSAGFVHFAPSLIQATGNVTTPLIYLNENAGTAPDLLRLEGFGSTFAVDNTGRMAVTGATITNAWLSLPISSITRSHISFTPGADVTIGNREAGDWWYTNTGELNFYTGSATLNLLSNGELFAYDALNGNTFLQDQLSDLAIGGNSVATASFSVDQSANSFRVGSGATANARIDIRSVLNDSVSIDFLTTDAYHINGGNLFIGSSIESLASFAASGDDLYADSDMGVNGNVYHVGNIMPNANFTGTNPYFGSHVGTSTNAFANIYSGEFFGKQLSITAFDLAEEYLVDDASIAPGDVVRFKKDGDKLVVERAGGTEKSYDDEVVGVISTEPGLYLRSWKAENENGRPVALAGRVPVKVTSENGAIKRGDYLTTASKPGYAMKATKGGFIIGRAMEDFSGSGDSQMVAAELESAQTEALATITELKMEGEITGSEVTEVTQLVQEVTAEASTTYGEGRILMYVDLGYIGDSVYLSRGEVIDSVAVEDFTLENGEKLYEIIETGGDVKLVTGGEIEATGLSTNVIRAKDIDDITVRLANGKGLKVIDSSGGLVLGVSDNGKLSLKEGEGSSVGVATIVSGETEIFVNHPGVTENSRIILSKDRFGYLMISELIPGSGFRLTIETAPDSALNVDYLVIN